MIDRTIHVGVDDKQIVFRGLQNAPYVDIGIVVPSFDEKYLKFNARIIVRSG
jgi:hypothetical protein